MSEQSAEAMSCGVCAEPLFPGRSGGEVVVWLHRPELVNVWPENRDIPPEELDRVKQDLGHEGIDHMAVPVPRGQVDTKTRCDFCSSPRPGWVLPTEPFEANPQQAFDSDWVVCDPCARLIKKDRWEGVLRRAVDTAAAKHQIDPNQPELVEGLKGFLSQVREYQTGPVRRATSD